mmetsp:Transcript_80478/g.232561  ORF Transcript_80478/g.232561 Transcript_80478/m.232561 type:complete len:207 (+) Transcript_80478:672-1292(+)
MTAKSKRPKHPRTSTDKPNTRKAKGRDDAPPVVVGNPPAPPGESRCPLGVRRAVTWITPWGTARTPSAWETLEESTSRKVPAALSRRVMASLAKEDGECTSATTKVTVSPSALSWQSLISTLTRSQRPKAWRIPPAMAVLAASRVEILASAAQLACLSCMETTSSVSFSSLLGPAIGFSTKLRSSSRSCMRQMCLAACPRPSTPGV